MSNDGLLPADPSALLPADEDSRKHLAGIMSFAATLVHSNLSREKSSERSGKALKKIYRFVGDEVERALTPIRQLPQQEQRELLPECKAGCSHCCYQWVCVGPLEVLAIADFIRESFSNERKEALLEELRQYRNDIGARDLNGSFSIKCPLLVNDLCSVYEVRPIICRGVASRDAEACRKGKESPESGVQIPYIAPTYLAASFIRQGVGLGSQSVGVGDRQLVLGLALLIALEDDQTAEKLFKGEDVFESAAASLKLPVSPTDITDKPK